VLAQDRLSASAGKRQTARTLSWPCGRKWDMPRFFDAARALGKLAPPVDLLPFLARQAGASSLHRRRLVPAFPAPLAQGLGGRHRVIGPAHRLH
jgi:hypothetical protein